MTKNILYAKANAIQHLFAKPVKKRLAKKYRMKKLSLLAIGIFISVACLCQTWETKELKPQYEVSYSQTTDETFYKTSYLQCLENFSIACANTWWCNSAIALVIWPTVLFQCRINPETNWAGNIHLTREK